MQILSSNLTETRFAWPKPDEEGMPLEKIKSTTCQTNDVTYMSGRSSNDFDSHIDLTVRRKYPRG